MAFKSPRLWLVVTLWWTLHGMILTIDGMTMRDSAGVPAREGLNALATSLVTGWLWIPFTMALVALVERFPIERGRLATNIALYTGIILGVVLVRGVAVYLLDGVVHWYPETDTPALTQILLISLRNNFLSCWLIVGVAHALLYYRQARERELQAIELESKFAVARLQALQSQLNPHFLFNALNSVSELVHHCPDAADRMLVALGRLLRENLEGADNQEIPLRDEISLLEQYVALEKLRLGDRLEMRWEIDRELLDAPVPRLLLQPLVENAIHHVIGLRTTPGSVTVSARRRGDGMTIEVRDDGETLASGYVDGIGLSNTRERLQALYGAAHRFELARSADNSETVARIRLPLVSPAAPR